MSKEIKVGQLLEIKKSEGSIVTYVIHNLTQDGDVLGKTFGVWPIRRCSSGEWQMYGIGGGTEANLVVKWLPEEERITPLQFARALKDYGFEPKTRREILAQYNISRTLPENGTSKS